ncbi:hypothetical protein GGI04_005367 [Coemansia thaxteri]|nr:hypothetical protein GGI04_005367 [Coemansia thaxteri]
MELDSPAQTASEVAAAESRTPTAAVFTPPQSTSNTPQRISTASIMDFAEPQQQLRANDSAAPESPTGSGQFGEYMDNESENDEEDYEESVAIAAAEAAASEMHQQQQTRLGDRSRTHGSRAAREDLDIQGSVGFEESEHIEHTDFFNSFGQDWLIVE